MDCIKLEGMKFRCAVGVSAEERLLKNDIVIDIFLYTDLKKIGTTNNIYETIDYEKIFLLTEDVMTREFALLETIGNCLLEKINLHFSSIEKIAVRITKLKPLMKGVEKVSVEIQSP